jgi:HEAT repeat protein
MQELKKAGVSLSLGLALLILTGFGSKEHPAPPPSGNAPPEVFRHIALLRTGKAQQKAAAAYWLGQQRAVAASAVQALAGLLGDTTEVDPSLYRPVKTEPKSTLGIEAAAALVNIGHPSIEPLIRVLKTSPQPEARKNAAWALGALHEAGADNSVRGPAARWLPILART